jgi:curli biogenesis system outer membrane secretion channel CsgG
MRYLKSALVLLAVMALISPAAASAQEGGLRYTVSVTEFENQAGWSGAWDIGYAWGTVFTDMLNQSGQFIVLGESDMRGAAMAEQDLAASGATAQGKAPVTGQLTPAQILVKGAITHVQHDSSGGGGGVRIGGLRVGGSKSTSEINITIYMVDSTTGQILASKSVIGKSDSKGATTGFNTGSWGATVGGHDDDNLGMAISDAAGVALEFMTTQLPDVTWRGSVVVVRDGQVYINRGTREGVAVGQQFVVGTLEVIRDPGTGEVLDESVVETARLEAVTVREKLSICKVVSGDGAAIEVGQGVMAGSS